jgi:hypothetical protein
LTRGQEIAQLKERVRTLQDHNLGQRKKIDTLLGDQQKELVVREGQYLSSDLEVNM